MPFGRVVDTDLLLFLFYSFTFFPTGASVRLCLFDNANIQQSFPTSIINGTAVFTVPSSGLAFVGCCHQQILCEEEAHKVLAAIKERLASCKLRLNEEKTQIVYCRDYRREKKHYGKKFDFLGFRFQPRSYRSNRGGMFLGYGCSISPASTKRIAREWKEKQFHRWTNATLPEIAVQFNPILRGIINYYGKYSRKGMERLL